MGDPQLDAGYHLARMNDEEVSHRDQQTSAEALKNLRLDNLEDKTLRDALARLETFLPADDAVLRALIPRGTLDEAVESIRRHCVLRDHGTIERLKVLGQEEFAKQNDVVLRVGRMRAKALRDAAELARSRAFEEGQVSRGIGRAFFAVYGTSIPPDATGTMRISDGRVKGFPSNGTIAPWFTSLYGLYARNTEFEGKPPFDLPQVWDAARSRLDLKTRFNLVSTCDIIGGNSGSPMIDQQGRLVGLVFDGNIESLANRFVFTDEVARTVCVHPQIIITALRDVFGCDALVKEILGN
jgi:hypothetical protein